MTRPRADAVTQSLEEQYAACRYLKSLSDVELKTRYLDLLENVLDFTPEGRPHLETLNSETRWTSRISDVRAEANLRQLPSGWTRSIEQTVLNRPYPNAKRAIDLWRGKALPPNSLVKYGHRQHMRDFSERGIMRLTPASCYRDPLLSPAIYDDELAIQFSSPPGTKMQVEMDKGLGIYHDIPGVDQVSYKSECPDYYVFCTSAIFDPRAFDEFKYDACAIVGDYRKALERINAQHVPANLVSAGRVKYVDPRMPAVDLSPAIPLTKHMRFEYQQEWRIFWTEVIPQPPLEPYVLELGDLSSFCELIEL